MPLRKLIPGFLVRFILVFGLLIVPWPGLNKLYAEGFRAIANAVFARADEKWILHFDLDQSTQGTSAVDTQIIIGNRRLADSSGKGPVALLELNTRSVGWLPTALTIALIVATPIQWQRKFWALLWGMLLINLFILSSVAVYIWDESTTISLVTLSPVAKQIADAMEYTFISQLGISFSVPVLIWIAVLFRSQDFRRFAAVERGENIV